MLQCYEKVVVLLDQYAVERNKSIILLPIKAGIRDLGGVLFCAFEFDHHQAGIYARSLRLLLIKIGAVSGSLSIGSGLVGRSALSA